MKQEQLDALLQEPIVGVIATLRRNGMPYTVPAWWLWKDGAFWLTGTYNRVWCKQLMHDPRMSLCVDVRSGKAAHFEVDGTAQPLELPDFDIWPVSRELADKYIGRGDPSNVDAVDAFLTNMKTEPRLLFKLTPETWRAIDLSVYRGKRADREYQAGSRTRERLAYRASRQGL